MPTIWFWPNPDAGTGEMSESIRHFREHHEAITEKMRFITNVPVDEFIALLRVTACLVGNSSAGIKECSFLGTPVVDIGARQQGRLHGEHVVHVAYEAAAIASGIRAQSRHGAFSRRTCTTSPMRARRSSTASPASISIHRSGSAIRPCPFLRLRKWRRASALRSRSQP